MTIELVDDEQIEVAREACHTGEPIEILGRKYVITSMRIDFKSAPFMALYGRGRAGIEVVPLVLQSQENVK